MTQEEAEKANEQIKQRYKLLGDGWTVRKCGTCRGAGYDPRGNPCFVCDGDGEIWKGPLER